MVNYNDVRQAYGFPADWINYAVWQSFARPTAAPGNSQLLMGTVLLTVAVFALVGAAGAIGR
jgi:hypothetical protein